MAHNKDNEGNFKELYIGVECWYDGEIPGVVMDLIEHTRKLIVENMKLKKQLAKGYGDTSWIDEYPEKKS